MKNNKFISHLIIPRLNRFYGLSVDILCGGFMISCDPSPHNKTEIPFLHRLNEAYLPFSPSRYPSL